MQLATQFSASRCQAAAARPAGARRGCRQMAVRSAADSGDRRQQQQQGSGTDRRQALLGLAAMLAATQAQPALAGGELRDRVCTPSTPFLPCIRADPLIAEVETFYGLATPPTSYGGYGGTSQSRQEDGEPRC